MVIAGLDASQLVGADGLLRPASGPVGLVVDHCVTGTSSVPAVTVRARPATSQAWFDRSDDAVVAELLGAVGLVADGATQVQVRRWRYARSAVRAPVDHVVAVADPVLVVAGDAFGGAAAAVPTGNRAPVVTWASRTARGRLARRRSPQRCPRDDRNRHERHP